MNAPKKRGHPAKEIGGGSLPPSSHSVAHSPLSGGHPRNAPGEVEHTSKWVSMTIGELIQNGNGEVKTGPFGTKLKASEYTETGVPVISVGEVGFGRFNLRHETPKVDVTVTSRMPEYILQTGDIVFGRKGAVERSAIVKKAENGWFLGSDGIRLRLPSSVDPLFISYQFLTDSHKVWMHQHAAGSTMPSLNQGTIERIPVSIPPLPIQKRIASILGTLDDKIALNRRINQTLEAMAQALFQSWFVDFDPVKAKQQTLDAGGTAQAAELAAMQVISGKSPAQLKVFHKQQPEPYAELERTAKLFPSKLVESELGFVPEGWEVRCVESFADRIAMGPFGSNIKVSTFVEAGVPIISGQHLREMILTDNEKNFITEEHAEKLKNSKVKRGDIIFTHAGNIGQVSIIPSKSKYREYVLSQRQFFLRVNESLASKWFAIHFFRSPNGQHLLLSNASQVGVPSIARPSSHLKSIELVFPAYPVQQSFEKIIISMMENICVIRDEIELLTTTRESLLPKLLSGEIDVSSTNVVGNI